MLPTSSESVDRDTPSRLYRPALIGAFSAVAIFLTFALILILHGSPLGHDEAVYSLRARHFVEGRPPAFYWKAYRAPGFPFVLQLAWVGSGTEPFLRLVTAAFGVPLLATTMYIGHRLFGLTAAIIGTVGLAVTPLILATATQVWPDIPGAALGLSAIALYVYAIDGPRASLWMLGVPFVTFLATMLRFGAPLPIAIGLIGITVWRWRTALTSKTLVLATALLTGVAGWVVLYVPAVTGWAQLSNPITPAVALESLVARNDFPWYTSFVNYARTGTPLFWGIPTFALVIGLVVAVVFALRRTDRSREVWIAVGIGGATFLAISLVLHGELRYLSPVLPWLWLVAGYGYTHMASDRDRTLTFTVALVLVGFVAVDALPRANTYNSVNRDRFTAIKTAGVGIDDVTEDNECGAISGYTPQIGWYSHCPTKGYDLSDVDVDSEYFGAGPTTLVFVVDGKRQPSGDLRVAYEDAAIGPVGVVGEPSDGRLQYIELWVVDPQDG